MIEDFLVAGARAGPGSSPGLAEADAMPVAGSLQKKLAAIFLRREVIAWN